MLPAFLRTAGTSSDAIAILRFAKLFFLGLVAGGGGSVGRAAIGDTTEGTGTKDPSRKSFLTFSGSTGDWLAMARFQAPPEWLWEMGVSLRGAGRLRGLPFFGAVKGLAPADAGNRPVVDLGERGRAEETVARRRPEP